MANIHKKKTLNITLKDIVLLTITGIVMIFMLYPAYWVFYGSFKKSGSLFSSESFGFTFDNYIKLFESGFGNYILNSLFICLLAVSISTVIAVVTAYIFSRKNFRGKKWFMSTVLAGQMFPWIILITPLFIMFASLGLMNSYTGMVFIYIAISIPFSIYLLLGYLQSIPKELDEAATIDGCSTFQVLWEIIYPLIRPGIVATATYSFILCWSDYLFALAFLTKTSVKTIPLGLSQLFGEYGADWGAVMAASAVTTLPVLLLFLPIQSKIASGLTSASVKG
ncbi:MAG TPA: carbohydrate ABC transporter permease [Alphaproteobacteria bacterium]|jgi:ABC-type glycerol-3-phosphate transport system permease component|nr:carbohydrate ABC transporter permease [Alphaproteobacteria bacterium]|tara:strand:- start:25 stop:864 length:840 start_codon:yes stop_codon:yes gene_type:complete